MWGTPMYALVIPEDPVTIVVVTQVFKVLDRYLKGRRPTVVLVPIIRDSSGLRKQPINTTIK